MRRNEKQRRVSSSTTSRTASILRAPSGTYTSLRNEKPPFPHQQPRSAYISNLETPILQSSTHTQATYVPPPPPIYAVESDYLESQKQHRDYPRQEIHGNVQSRQNYPTWKGTTTVLQQNSVPEHHFLSFHTSAV
ncbi:unnamed protein product [Onchocerca ochengi]|uniref:Uncharacterized protein n=1 Tax=Onchocerca ochengi TaxID=42157 RepID=A0A182EFB8_ONCOC|nr:unnamed protein product [Onchocerca ochengi]